MARIQEEEKRRAGPWPLLDRSQLTAAAEALAAAHPDVVAVYLFGSRARGRAHAASDVDVAVLLDPPVPQAERISTQEDLSRFLEERLHTPVDVVVLSPDLSPGLLFDIFAIEMILYAHDRDQAHQIASQARNEYRDLLPRLERGFRRTQRRIEEWARASHGS